MNIIALMILAQIRAQLANMVSEMWLLGFLKDPQQPNGTSSTGHSSNVFPLCALATVSFVIAGGCLYWMLHRRNRARV